MQKIQDKVAQVVLSINHNPEKYIHLNLPLIPDARDSYQGPLIGIYSAMEWIENNVLTERPEALLCIPADVPFFPEDLIVNCGKHIARKSVMLFGASVMTRYNLFFLSGLCPVETNLKER